MINTFTPADLLTADGAVRGERRRAAVQPVQETVARIVASVRERGDAALLQHARELDGVDMEGVPLRVPSADFDAADAAVDPGVRDALERMVANVRAHHRRQLPEHRTWMVDVAPGVLTGERWTPVASVGLYVPRGKGSFPSVMAMLCVPAVLAEVPYVAVCTPPGPGGSVDAASLVVARLCGVEHVFRVGGAQAVAALAFGTESVPRVDKIVGPGSRYVTAAKQLVYGVVDPGPPAGPSESIVLCDGGAAPEVAASELLVEAEHGPDSAALLVTDSAAVADEVRRLLPALVESLPDERRSYCEAVLSGLGGIVLTRDLAESIDFVNAYAPEHLRLLVSEPFDVLHRVVNAGEILLGEHSSIAYGNYGLGVNAILPTAGMARSFSCVGVTDFMKRSSFAYVMPEGVADIARTAVRMADYEGFPAHARAAQLTLDRVSARAAPDPAGRLLPGAG